MDSLPAGAKWVASISHIQWCVRALGLNEFTGATFSCTPGQRCLAVSIYACGGDAMYVTNRLLNPIKRQNKQQTGKEVLNLYSWDGSSIGLCLLYLGIIMAVFLLLGYVVLRRSLPKYMPVAKPLAPVNAGAGATAVVVPSS